MDMDNSVVITKGKVVGEVEEGMGRINGDGQRLDWRW